MKKIIIAALLLITVIVVNAQYEDVEKNKGFKKENLFTGGSLIVAFYSGGTVLGISPSFGYSLNKIIDAGIELNFTYTGETAYTGDKYRQYVYGPGAFVRIYPIKMLFIQGIYEHNFTSVTLKPAYGGPSQQYNVDGNSFLIGGGYCSGRQGVGSMFYYFSVMVDIANDPNSPYVVRLQDGSLSAQPIIKAGIQIPLFQGGNRDQN